MKRIALFILAALVACMAIEAKKMSDLKIYINPGHGGYGGDDRGLAIWPYCKVDTAGYWESKSNLVKGIHMYNILDSIGMKGIMMSRWHNTEEDDRGLAEIGHESTSWGADMFISIHSNAGEAINYPLMIYHAGGKIDDWTGATTVYREENKRMSEIVNDVFNTSKYSNWINYKGEINTEAPGRVTSDVALLGYSLGVLRNLDGIGMLSEGGMHEHRPQAHRLMSDDYNWLEAWYFVKSIMIYFDTEDRFVTGNVAGVVYDDHNIRELEYTGIFAKHTMLGRDKNMPLNGSYVELLDEAGNVVQTRTTDKDYNGVFVFRNVTPGNYKIRTSKDGYYTEEKDVVVVADEVTYQDMPLSLKREFPLAVTSYHPKVADGELVSCGDKIVLEFNTDIVVEEFEKAFSIVPAVDGYFQYEGSYHKVSFIPTVSFDKDTDYTVTIAKSACTPDTRYENNTMTEDFVFKFTTQNRERLLMTESYPSEGGSVHYAKPTVEFRFDGILDGTLKPVSLVKVYDKNNNEFSINTRNSKYNQLTNGYGNLVVELNGNLTVGETYRAVISEELRDEDNLPLGKNMEITFTAKNEGEEKEGTVLEGFNDASLFTYNADETVGITSTTPKYARYTTTKLFDTASGRFSYNFASNRDGIVVWDYAGTATAAAEGDETTSAGEIYKGDIIGLHINGDFNNHELYVGVTAGTDTKYEKICDLSFRGWGYYEVAMNSLEENVAYRFSDIKLVQVTSAITQKGAFMLDNMVLKSTGVGGVEGITYTKDVINVYPNPASDVIYVNSPVEVSALELINIQGVKVAENIGKTSINVEDVNQGVYVLKVITEDGVTLHRVAISK